MKNNQKQYELIVIANDFHVPFHDTKAVKLLEKFLADQKPDVFVINGDFLDMWDVSSFDRTPRFGEPLIEELRMGRTILERFRKILPKSKIIYLAGNHEHRVAKMVIRKAPELYGLPGLSVSEMLGLKDLNIIYKDIQKGASSFTDNWICLAGLYIGHWNKVNKHAGYTAKNLLDEKGVSLIQGHTHKYGISSRRYVDGREIMAIENFCLCELEPSYVSKPSWSQGFSVVYGKKGVRPHAYPIPFVDYKFFFGNKEYSLNGVTQARKIRAH